MKLKQLKDKQVVEYRLGHAGQTNVVWEDWKSGPLYLQRSPSYHFIVEVAEEEKPGK